MKIPASDVNTWQQQALIPPASVRITCEIVTDLQHDLHTFHVRAIDEGTGAPLAAWTRPLMASADFEQGLASALAELSHVISSFVMPF